jgi:MFS family permease
LRAFGDGFVSVLLPVYLLGLGFSEFQIGAVATATLVGSAALTLVVGLVAHRFRVRPLLLSASVLMAATGLGFVLVHDFWPLLLVAFIGTLNPSSGDVSVFLPLEQSVLPSTSTAQQRTALFARYSLIGSLVGAAGALFSGLPQLLAVRTGFSPSQALQSMFVLYGMLGLISIVVYRRLSPSLEQAHQTRAPLRESRRIVYTSRHCSVWMPLAQVSSCSRCSPCGCFSASIYLSPPRAPSSFGQVCSRRSPIWLRRDLAQRIGLINTMGLHPPAVQCSAVARALHADAAPGPGFPFRAECLVSDGRANTQLVRDGGCAPTRTTSGSECDRGAPQFG